MQNFSAFEDKLNGIIPIFSPRHFLIRSTVILYLTSLLYLRITYMITDDQLNLIIFQAKMSYSLGFVFLFLLPFAHMFSFQTI